MAFRGARGVESCHIEECSWGRCFVPNCGSVTSQVGVVEQLGVVELNLAPRKFTYM